jgi:DNA-binding transcriptional LysR family regulator
LDLHHLNAYVAVAEELHFSRAARRLFMSQSALSRLVRGLEAELGVVLLDRSTRHVALTPAGSTFLREARVALGQVDAAMRAAQAAQDQVDTLRVAYCDATEVALADALQCFRMQRPAVALSLQELDRNELMGGWSPDIWDVALCRERVDGPHAISEHVGDEPLCVHLPKDHPLVVPTSLTLSQLSGTGSSLVLPAGLLPEVRAALPRRSPGSRLPSLVQDVPTFAAAAVLVSAGLGVGIGPRSMCVTLGLPGIVCRPLADVGMHVPVYAVRRRHDASAHVTGLIRALVQTGLSARVAVRGSIDVTTA